MNYYNEFDPKAAAWLRELIKGGHIANGVVDERSITDVQPDELREYTQCHFFAGIGGWSYALRLAGWPDDRPVWTGSCPCQPFSCAGKQLGTADKRHLWPDFRRLIAECRPANVFGEQVASAAGREWLAGVRDDLEAMAYAVGPPICALRARARPTSDSASSGWQTPTVQDGCGRDRHNQRDGSVILSLLGQAKLAGWPTPNTPSGGRSVDTSKMSSTGMTLDGRKHTVSLEHVVRFAGWPTPMAGNPGTEEYNPAGNTDSSRKTTALVGWATPTSRDHKDGSSEGTVPVNGLLGRQVWASRAQTARLEGYRLNPLFSLWLMGFPSVAWGSCGVEAMRSCRKSRLTSSKQRKNPQS